MNESNNNKIKYVGEGYNKNECGKLIFTLKDINTEELKEISEEELCKLAVNGQIEKLEFLEGRCMSELMVKIMLNKNEVYSVIGKAEDDSGKEIVAYEFEDTKKNIYILRVKEALELVSICNEKVKNAKLNHNENYLVTKDKTDLRGLRRIIAENKWYLDQVELKRYYERCKSMREEYILLMKRNNI